VCVITWQFWCWWVPHQLYRCCIKEVIQY